MRTLPLALLNCSRVYPTLLLKPILYFWSKPAEGALALRLGPVQAQVEEAWSRHGQVFGTSDFCTAACSLHELPKVSLARWEGAPRMLQLL